MFVVSSFFPSAAEKGPAKLPPPNQRHIFQTHKEDVVNSPLDDPPFPNLKCQRLASIIARVELRPVGSQGATIVDGDRVAKFGLAVALDGG